GGNASDGEEQGDRSDRHGRGGSETGDAVHGLTPVSAWPGPPHERSQGQARERGLPEHLAERTLRERPSQTSDRAAQEASPPPRAQARIGGRRIHLFVYRQIRRGS